MNHFLQKYEKKLKVVAGKPEQMEQELLELHELGRAWTLFKRKGLGSSLSTFRAALALGQLTESTHREDEGLILSTVHSMKGLEKDIVFLMGMSEGTFPDYRATSEQEIEEERNLAFVAVTRAKRWLYLTYPKQRTTPWGSTKPQQASRFLPEHKTFRREELRYLATPTAASA